jgi:hypothetical protein
MVFDGIVHHVVPLARSVTQNARIVNSAYCMLNRFFHQWRNPVKTSIITVHCTSTPTSTHNSRIARVTRHSEPNSPIGVDSLSSLSTSVPYTAAPWPIFPKARCHPQHLRRVSPYRSPGRGPLRPHLRGPTSSQQRSQIRNTALPQ